MLHWPDYSKPFTLEVNASQYALGVILYQYDERKKPLVMGHFSKTLIPAEKNYDIHHHELLELIWGLENWWHLLLSTEQTTMVYTDHENLCFYKHPQTITLRVAHIWPQLVEYNLILKHKSGATN
jgi:hypothetical protein